MAPRPKARVPHKCHTPALPRLPTEVDGIKPATKLVVVGSAAVDVSAKAAPVAPGGSALCMHSTSPGEVTMTLGGVGRNIAEAAHRSLVPHSSKFNETTLLVSPIGDDSFGRVISDHMNEMGMRTDGLVRADGKRSAVCNMVLDSDGNLVGGVADMNIIQALEGDQVGVYNHSIICHTRTHRGTGASPTRAYRRENRGSRRQLVPEHSQRRGQLLHREKY